MADDMRKLLDYIVRTFVVHDVVVAIDQDASASGRGESIAIDKRRAVQRETDRAAELSEPFRKGLLLASDGLVVLDDRNPDENEIADALIQMLVRHDLATSRTVETDANHYRYRIMINWKRLEAAAEEAGVDLEHLLRRGS